MLMQESLFARCGRQPVIVACGVGRDSVAMLVEMHILPILANREREKELARKRLLKKKLEKQPR